jgi:hypothetical protein
MKTEAAHARESREDPLGLEVVNYPVKNRFCHVSQFAFHVVNKSVEFFAGGSFEPQSKSEAIPRYSLELLAEAVATEVLPGGLARFHKPQRDRVRRAVELNCSQRGHGTGGNSSANSGS